MAYKSRNGLAPDSSLCFKFLDHCSVSTYSLKNFEGKLSVQLPRTEFRRRSFSYAGAELWNSLPIELRLAQTLQKFQSAVDVTLT